MGGGVLIPIQLVKEYIVVYKSFLFIAVLLSLSASSPQIHCISMVILIYCQRE